MKASVNQVIEILKQYHLLDSNQVKSMENRRDRYDEETRTRNVIFAFEEWMYLKQSGLNISKFFENNKYNSIAIYGMAELGNCLLNELCGTSIRVEFAIDRKAKKIECGIPICTIEDEKFDEYAANVDAIVVTAIVPYNSIREELQKKYRKPIISLLDILKSMVCEYSKGR
jgi:hypothetical protein